MKKYVALLITFVLTFTLFACGTAPGDDLPKGNPQELIAQGRYLDAYKVLLTKNDAAFKAELKNFIFLPKQSTQADGNGNSMTMVYTWDNQGRPMKAVATMGNNSRESVYAYGENSYTLTQNDVLTETTTLNAAGQFLKTIRYLNGDDTITEEYSYDQQGNLIELISTNSGNESPTITTYNYDEQGRCTRKKDAYDESSFEAWDYFYDQAGRRVKEVQMVSYDDTVYETVWTYNDHGLLIKEVKEKIESNGNKEITSEKTIQYGENGKPSSMFHDLMDGYTYSYAWSYDEYGNLTKEKLTRGREDSKMTVTTEHQDYIIFYMPTKNALMGEVLASFQPGLD